MVKKEEESFISGGGMIIKQFNPTLENFTLHFT
jgi:hypothetical protein